MIEMIQHEFNITKTRTTTTTTTTTELITLYSSLQNIQISHKLPLKG